MHNRSKIQKAIKSKSWQDYRKSLKGLSTNTKLVKLNEWISKNNYSANSLIQVENYKNALRRGGLL